MDTETSTHSPMAGQTHNIFGHADQCYCQHCPYKKKLGKKPNPLNLTRLQKVAAWILFFYPCFSVTALAMFTSVIPDVVAHRLSKPQGGHWTGRWVEIPAVIILGIASITNFVIFWFYGAGSKVKAKTSASIHIVLSGHLIWTLALVSCAGGSVLWHEQPYHGSGKVPKDLLSVCNTLTGKGRDCSQEWLKAISGLHVSALALFVCTLATELCLLVISCIEYRKALRAKAKLDMTDNKAILEFSNEIKNSEDFADSPVSFAKEALVYHNSWEDHELEFKHDIVNIEQGFQKATATKSKESTIIR